MRWVVALVVLGTASAASVQEKEPIEGEERDPKLFSIFQIVKFNNDECATNQTVEGEQLMGTCYTAAECSTAGGASDGGTCASGFGVCCYNKIDPCDTTSGVRLNTTYLVNPGYPGTVGADGACTTGSASRQISGSADYTWSIYKYRTDVEQIRFDFIVTDLSAPSAGDCTNDTLTITGADAVTNKILPTNLCGVLTGGHLYVSVKDLDTNALSLSIKLGEIGSQRWAILVRQYVTSQTDYLAPRGCLQYYRATSGNLMSFNYNGGNGELLNDQMYSACIAQTDDFCDMSLTGTIDLTGSSGSCSDKIALGCEVLCGSTFGTNGALTWNYTGPYVIPMASDSDNSAMVGGYSIDWTLLPC